MAVFVVARMAGNPDELADKVLRHLTPVMTEVAPSQGALWHALAKTPDGVMVVDVWESADGLTRVLGEQRVQDAIAQGALPDPQIDVYALVDHRTL
jgi:quinol monooxygenase YgiN